MPSQSEFLLNFTLTLKARGKLPKNIEISQLGHVILASIFDELKSEIITESIYTGMDVDPYIAVLKGLVEMTERKAFLEGKRAGLTSCKTERSDGFAAFPFGIVSHTQTAARNNALNEAIERFAWASWWDDENIGHDFSLIKPRIGKSASATLLTTLSDFIPIDAIYSVSPKIANARDAVVIIYFAFIKPFGVISGGACGTATDIESIKFRAACELSRHAMALRKITTESATPVTFYERRLAYFALTEEGSSAAKDRILNRKTESVLLPNLNIDEIVPHTLDDIVCVHRCHFENQPPFVGGRLERLCL